MIRHVVLLHLDPATDRRTVEGIVEALESLPNGIDTIKHFQIGLDLGLAGTNATIAVIGDFADEDAYVVYRDHPVHRRIIDELITPVLTERSAIQFSYG